MSSGDTDKGNPILLGYKERPLLSPRLLSEYKKEEYEYLAKLKQRTETYVIETSHEWAIPDPALS